MNKLLLLKLCIFIVYTMNAQNATWVAVSDSSGIETVKAMKNDFVGNSYIIGSYQQGPAHFGNTTLTCSGHQDIFIAKCDSNGNYIWAKRGGGASSQFSTDNGNGLALDNSSNIYIAGDYRDTADFSGIILPGKGVRGFISKYDSSGNIIWVSKIKGTNISLGNITTNNDTTLFVHGSCFTGTITLNEGTPDSIVIPNSYNSSFFARYDSTGKASWAVLLPQTALIDDIISDNNNDIYISGAFYATATFGSTILTCNGVGDLFTAKYNGSTGNLIWVKKVGLVASNEQDVSIHFVMDADKNIYIGGYRDFSGGSNPSQGRLIKCDSSGNVVWSKVFNSNGSVYVTDLILINNDLLITGFYRSALTFASGHTLSYSGSSLFSLYIAKYDTAGNIFYSTQVTTGNNANNYGGIETDFTGAVYLGGGLSSSTAAPISIGNIQVTGNRTSDVFITKFSPSAITGTPEIFNQDMLSVYPNPTNNLLTIQESSFNKIYSVKILNVIGQQVFYQENVTDKIVIDVSRFEKGVYFVQTISGNKSNVEKVIIE